MRVLGIETSGDVASVAVMDDTGVLAEIQFRHRMELSRYLAVRVEEVLELAGLDLPDLQGIAVSVGPGSFTGLRMGVTAAKTLAFSRELPVAGIGTLLALAAERPAPPRALICSVLPASATHLFAALFQWHDGRPNSRAEEMLIASEDLAAKLAQSPMEVVLAGSAGVHRASLEDALGPRLTVGPEQPSPRAATVALLGRERLLKGDSDPVHALAPRYLRPSTAEARLLARDDVPPVS